MHRVRPVVFLLTLAIVLTVFPATPRPADAAAPVAYRGVIRYRMRGPAASPYGVGSALLVGAA
ncbi:MAG: hypothetical protein MUQ30_21110, partial [Anaerolineae bacterium]|nr:hypothetical protein [Anaerolineae bacterium]